MKNDNDLILERMRGVPANKPDWRSKFDPRNPNRFWANDNSPPVQLASHNSGEGDPSVMPDRAGGETLNAEEHNRAARTA